MNKDASTFAVFLNINHIDDCLAAGPVLFSEDSHECDPLSDPKCIFLSYYPYFVLQI